MDDNILRTFCLLPLQKLELSACTAITPPGLQSLLESTGRKIRYLGLSSLPNLTDHTLQAIVTFCPHLESLQLAGARNLTDQGLAQLGSLPLKNLDLEECSVGDAAVRGLVMGRARGVEKLCLSFCEEVG